MGLEETGSGGVDWIGLAQDRNRRRALVNSVLNLRVLCNAGKLSSGIRVVLSSILLVSGNCT
jgi:D-Tyr-tRNAtyr deacylase